jgi:dipeptidyl aminopeptidase/acylaminoacyl peptidase
LRFEFLPDGHLPVSRYTLEVERQSGPRSNIAFDRETDGLAYALPPIWGKDDRTLYVARRQRATARLFMVNLKSGRWRPVTPDTLAISRYAISQDGRVLLGVLENANRPQDIFRIDPADGSLTRLTHIGDDLTSMRLGHVQQVTWPSRDQRFTVHGFLVTPPAYDSTRRYPLIVLVHGGPGRLFTNSFLEINFARYELPVQLFAAAGYMVLLPNPRGDSSYGEEFAKGLHMDWGPGPFSDVDAGIDALIARGLVDSSAVGIAGASYGGYLTAYAITHSKRFAAASIDDGPVNLASEYAQNYAFHSSWAKATFDGTPWTKPEIYAAQSPITHVGRVRAPVIMRYGGRGATGDAIRQSYMLAQGFELYAGLRDTGVPVEFVLHPDQGHGITDWDLYRDWVMRNVRWFDYWMRGLGDDPLAAMP